LEDDADVPIPRVLRPLMSTRRQDACVAAPSAQVVTALAAPGRMQRGAFVASTKATNGTALDPQGVPSTRQEEP
jgi:hypothetical protein